MKRNIPEYVLERVAGISKVLLDHTDGGEVYGNDVHCAAVTIDCLVNFPTINKTRAIALLCCASAALIPAIESDRDESGELLDAYEQIDELASELARLLHDEAL